MTVSVLRLVSGALVLAAAVALPGCGDRQPAPAGTPAGAPGDEASTGAPAETGSATDGSPGAEGDRPAPVTPLARVVVTIYFPSADGEGLLGETREIFETAAPGDRAKQIVADLIEGPLSKQALRVLPAGTRLRQAYVVPDEQTAWLDFTPELKEALRGGSLQELLTVYSVINSVALNVPEIRRVGLLIGGEQIKDHGGHLDLTHPLRPDRQWILESEGPASFSI